MSVLRELEFISSDCGILDVLGRLRRFQRRSSASSFPQRTGLRRAAGRHLYYPGWLYTICDLRTSTKVHALPRAALATPVCVCSRFPGAHLPRASFLRAALREVGRSSPPAEKLGCGSFANSNPFFCFETFQFSRFFDFAMIHSLSDSFEFFSVRLHVCRMLLPKFQSYACK